MPREGRVYYQYLEFIGWEELPLPSPCRQFSPGVHPGSFSSLLGRWESQGMRKCQKVQNQSGVKCQGNSRAELRELRVGSWDPGAGDAAGQGTTVPGTFYSLPLRIFASLLAQEGKSRSRDGLDVEWSSLSTELI